jgi:hypothetical protein
MDLAETIVPKSDQLNADDLTAGAVTVTIADVRKGSAEQPVDIHLAEFEGRPFRPSKSMRRVLVEAWGTDSAAYIGRRITLYRDPEITFGRDKVGGIRISHLSHIKSRLTIPLTVTRGKRAPFVVQPLAEEKAQSKAELNIAACDSIPELREAWKYADPSGKKLIEARVKALETAALDEEAGA